MGKTTLVKQLLRQAPHKRIIVFDMHNEYCDTIQEMGGVCMPPVLPICELNETELLAATGLLRTSTSPIRMMRYLRYFVRTLCRFKNRDLKQIINKAADAMLMLDVLNPDVKSLTGDSFLVEFARAMRDELGNVTYNALKEIVRKDEERVAATLMYLMWAVENTNVDYSVDIPDIVAFQMLEFRSIFAVSDVSLALMSYVFRRLMEEREQALVVIEEAPKLLRDETARRNLELFLAQARKFGVTAVLVSQVPDELIQNTRLVVGRVQNIAWAKKLAALAPHMPQEVAKLLPQLRRGEFIYIDGEKVLPLRVVI